MPTFMISIKDNKKLHGKISLCINIYFKLMDVGSGPLPAAYQIAVMLQSLYTTLSIFISELIMGGVGRNQLFDIFSTEVTQTAATSAETPGPTGAQGLQGPQGPKGIQGVEGDNGPTGAPVPAGNVFVTNQSSNSVSVIDGTLYTTVLDISVGTNPRSVAVDATNNVSVIDASSFVKLPTITVGTQPWGVAINPPSL
ncbi:TPA: YncE family protein [Bacillus cereus]